MTPNHCLKDWPRWSPHLKTPPKIKNPLPQGRTNRSYLLTSSLGPLVLRIHPPNDQALGIDRHREAQILRRLAPTKIAPILLYQDPNHRYQICHYLPGTPWQDQDLKTPTQRRRLTALIRRYQKIDLDLPPFNYLDHLQNYWHQANARHKIDPQTQAAWQAFTPRLAALQAQITHPVLCHHDLTPANILETPHGLRILDWEYAAPGHPNFDQQTLPPPNPTSTPTPTQELQTWLTHLWTLITPP